MYSLHADSDLIAESDSRAELRGYLRDADFKAWAISAGYAGLVVCMEGAEWLNCNDSRRDLDYVEL